MRRAVSTPSSRTRSSSSWATPTSCPAWGRERASRRAAIARGARGAAAGRLQAGGAERDRARRARHQRGADARGARAALGRATRRSCARARAAATARDSNATRVSTSRTRRETGRARTACGSRCADDSPDGYEGALESLFDGSLPALAGLNPTRDVQVLTPFRRGPASTSQLNAFLQARLNPPARGRLETRAGDVTFARGRPRAAAAERLHQGGVQRRPRDGRRAWTATGACASSSAAPRLPPRSSPRER